MTFKRKSYETKGEAVEDDKRFIKEDGPVAGPEGESGTGDTSVATNGEKVVG